MNPISEHVKKLSLRQLGTRFLASGFLAYGFGQLVTSILSPFECNSFASGGCVTKGIITVASMIAVGLVLLGVEALSSLDEEIDVVLSRRHIVLVMVAGAIVSLIPALTSYYIQGLTR